MEQYYHAIAVALNNTVPEAYVEAKIRAEVTADTADVGVYYVTGSGQEKNVGLATSDAITVTDSFIDLRHEMTQSGQPPWSRAVFTLTPDGKFKLDVSYDD